MTMAHTKKEGYQDQVLRWRMHMQKFSQQNWTLINKQIWYHSHLWHSIIRYFVRPEHPTTAKAMTYFERETNRLPMCSDVQLDEWTGESFYKDRSTIFTWSLVCHAHKRISFCFRSHQKKATDPTQTGRRSDWGMGSIDICKLSSACFGDARHTWFESSR